MRLVLRLLDACAVFDSRIAERGQMALREWAGSRVSKSFRNEQDRNGEGYSQQLESQHEDILDYDSISEDEVDEYPVTENMDEIGLSRIETVMLCTSCTVLTLGTFVVGYFMFMSGGDFRSQKENSAF